LRRVKMIEEEEREVAEWLTELIEKGSVHSWYIEDGVIYVRLTGAIRKVEIKGVIIYD